LNRHKCSVLRARRQARFCVARHRSWWQMSPVVASVAS
ncbi:hypothetical protein A2U01_0078302, partial [Trifolium medium]|nr:hypothetical protein [Trifolium medium]